MKKLGALIGLSLIVQLALLLTPPPALAHGNNCDTATLIDVNAYVNGQINPPGEVDYFYFTLPAAENVTIFGNMDFGELIEGYLLDSTCTSTLAHGSLYSPYDPYPPYGFINAPSLPAGTYRLRVEGNYYSTTGNYWIYVAYEGPTTSPEMDVKGNGYSIPDGNTSPNGADNTLFDYIWGYTHTFTIVNTGTAALNLTGIPRVSISGTHAGDFNVIQQPDSLVEIGDSTTFQVVFHPSVAGLRNATIIIANDDSNENPYNFTIAGESLAVQIPEITLRGNGQEIIDGDTTPTGADGTDFGVVDVATGTVTHTFTIANSGSAALNLTGIPRVSISGTHAGDFSVTQQPNSFVIIGDSTTFQVVFQPNAAGLREATISIANDDNDENPYNFAVAGTGALQGPEITLRGNDQEIIDGDTTPTSTDDTDFGMAIVTDGTVTHPFTIANTGEAELNLTGTPYVSINGAHSCDFSVTVQPSSPVVAGATTTFQVRFAPSAEGLREATINIANDDGDEDPYDFAINGVASNSSSPEICDGIDNDCDGQIDEDFNVGDTCTVGQGACLSEGTMVCKADGTGTECNAVAGNSSLETCDGVDNDCDGQVDEDFNIGEACTVGQGACEATGTLDCKADGAGTECNAVPGNPTNEICDGIDNDCDGDIDEDFTLQSDPDNCGNCGVRCQYAHAAGLCINGNCLMGPCDEGYHNINNNPADGCEYACAVITEGIDVCEAADYDCDGDIDKVAPWTSRENIQHNMVIFGTAYDEQEAQVDDWIGAFGPGGELDCRAVGAIQTDGYYYLTAGGDEQGEAITFKLLTCDDGQILDSHESILFVPNETIAYKELYFGVSSQNIDLIQGWNWVSFNVLPDDISLEAIFNEHVDLVEQVKTQTRSATNVSGVGWMSDDLSLMANISKGVMFKIKAKENFTMEIIGRYVALTTQIDVMEGWSWVAYLPDTCLAVEQAIASIYDDLYQIKGQAQSKTKLSEAAFIGDLIEMCPGKGYTVKMNAESILIYPIL